jgi:hypothetical protein
VNSDFRLEDFSDESLDSILCLTIESKTKYFEAMVKSYYPKVNQDTDYFVELVESYISSFYLEKLYRSNRFFNEKFIPVYTNTGLIREVVSDLFFIDDTLIVH